MNAPRKADGLGSLPWQDQLTLVVDTVREMSSQTDPQAMVRAYAERIRAFFRFDRSVSLSRRGLEYPFVRVTRDSTWEKPINPWKEKDKLPVVRGGVLADWIYGNKPLILADLDVPVADPGAGFVGGYRSAMVIPHYDKGESLNMIVHLVRAPDAYDPERFPEFVLTSNLFGRATHNLVLSSELQLAYEAIDRELAVVAEIQRSLLPADLPHIPGLELAAHYQTSRRAGGDYYDLFHLPDDKWGILIADVSGHGTPAAVVMAIMHSIAHSFPGPSTPPQAMMTYLNRNLGERYTNNSGTFVTAFYGVYDPAQRTLTYSSAGHNPPRLVRRLVGAPELAAAPVFESAAAAVAGAALAEPARDLARHRVEGLENARNLPLGISLDETYTEYTEHLDPGDAILFYTDGVTEAWNPEGLMFGVERLDEAVAAAFSGNLDAAMGLGDAPPAQRLLRVVLNELNRFTDGHPADDDRTMLAAVAV